MIGRDVIVPSTTESTSVKALVLAVTSAGTTPPPMLAGPGGAEMSIGDDHRAWTSAMIVARAKVFEEYLLADREVQGTDEQEHDDHGDDDQHDHGDVGQPAVAVAAGDDGAADHAVMVPLALLDRTVMMLRFDAESTQLAREIEAIINSAKRIPRGDRIDR